MEGNCSNANETLISINTTCKEKQTRERKRKKHVKTHNTKKILLKKWGPNMTLGPFVKQ
jgi:hypothetical protein